MSRAVGALVVEVDQGIDETTRFSI